MVTHIDSSIYFWSLLFSTGILYAGYREFVRRYDDSRDKIISDLNLLVKGQNIVISALEKEIHLRTLVNDPVFLKALRHEFDDVRPGPENGSDADQALETTQTEE